MSELEDLLVRTLHDPARALPAPADPMAGIRSRARAQRRNTLLTVAAVVVLAVVAVLTPVALRSADDLPPASGPGLLDWAPRGALIGDAALLADAERAWREVPGAPRPAGPVSPLFAGTVGGRRTVLLQARDDAGAPMLAQTAAERGDGDPADPGGGPQRFVRADPLTDLGIPAVRLSPADETVLLVRPDTASIVVLGSSYDPAFLGPDDTVLYAASGLDGKQVVALALDGRVLADGTISADGGLPLVRGPVRVAAPTWQRLGLTPRDSDLVDAGTLADRIGAAGTAGDPIEVAAVSGGSSIEIGGRMVEPRLYELRWGGRTWLASAVDVFGAGLRCPRAVEITGRVADVHAYVSRCRLPELRGGLLALSLGDGVRATGLRVQAAGPGQLDVRDTARIDGGLVQAFDTNFPTGPGRVTLVDAAGKALPPLELPAYS